MDEPRSAACERKVVLRRSLLAARRRQSSQQRADAATANAAHLGPLLAGTGTVCAYLPLPSEPLRIDFLNTLVAVGIEVLVPVVTAGSPLDWCRYPVPVAVGAFGISEPTGPRLGAQAVATAQTLLVPALAVDRTGRRLGRGGGHYDRTLALLDPVSPQLIAVLFDGEIIEQIPAESHDIAVTSVVTPSLGFQHLRS